MKSLHYASEVPTSEHRSADRLVEVGNTQLLVVWLIVTHATMSLNWLKLDYDGEAMNTDIVACCRPFKS
jgi:hypothetical protein